ncbi:MAG: alpha/beta hydrolase [Marinosulfonomonas sp.]
MTVLLLRGLIFCVLVLSGVGCSRTTQVVLDPSAVGVGDIEHIFVATTRDVDQDGKIDSGRSAAPRYYQYDISVPPDRTQGEIKNPRGKPDPKTEFVATKAVAYPDRRQFETAMSAKLSKLPASDKEAVIYVHGFNNTFSDGIVRLAQLTHDFQRKGVAVHYAWPSKGKALGYEYDRDSVLFSRDGLQALIESTRRAGARHITLVGHSMGSQLIMETLRQMEISRPGTVRSSVNALILISPDIDVNVFKSQANRISKLPEPFIIFVSQKDRALGLSSLISGEKERVGNIQDISELGDYDIAVVDVTEFSKGLGHNTVADTPELIELFAQLEEFAGAFSTEGNGRVTLVDTVALTVRSATKIVLTPVEAITE